MESLISTISAIRERFDVKSKPYESSGVGLSKESSCIKFGGHLVKEISFKVKTCKSGNVVQCQTSGVISQFISICLFFIP